MPPSIAAVLLWAIFTSSLVSTECAARGDIYLLGQCLIRSLIHAGVYNEEVFASLDWVLAEAANRNLRIILPIEVCPEASKLRHACSLHLAAL